MERDNFLGQLNGDWALLADPNQWVIAKRRLRGTESDWKAVAYVGSTKAVLLRVLREYAVNCAPEGEALLAGLPEKFVEWRALGAGPKERS